MTNETPRVGPVMDIRDRCRKGRPVVGSVWRDAHGNHAVAPHNNGRVRLDRSRLDWEQLRKAIRANKPVFYI